MKKFFLVLSLVFISVLGVNAAQKDTVKVLAIGNSFSEDAIEQHLSALARAEGLNVIICNMYRRRKDDSQVCLRCNRSDSLR